MTEMSEFRGNFSSGAKEFNVDYGTVTVGSAFKTIPLILVSIASFIGNSMVLLAIYRFKNLRTFSNMYIGSLAITDIMASLVMPFSYITVLTNGRWLFGGAMCTINGFLLTFLAGTSMWTLLAFSMYRCYLVTTIQKRLSAVLLGKVVKTSVISIWVLAFIYASPPLFGGGKFRHMPSYYSCILDFSSSKYYAEFLFVFVFGVPLIVMIVAYVRIVKFIMMHNKTIRSSATAREQRRQSGAFSPSSETSVNEGNRYTVMELKRKLDLMNEGRTDAEVMVQSQLKNVLSQKTQKDQASLSPRQNTSKKLSIKTAKPSNTEVETLVINSGQTSEDITSCSKEDRTDADAASETEGNPSNESTSDNNRTQETFKKISVSSVVQKWRNRVQNKQDFLRLYKRRVSHQARLARILLVTVVMFLGCWSPFAVDSFLLGVGYTRERPAGFQLASQWMAFANALCNPVIYSLLNARLRAAFKTILEEFWQFVFRCNRTGEDEVFETEA